MLIFLGTISSKGFTVTSTLFINGIGSHIGLSFDLSVSNSLIRIKLKIVYPSTLPNIVCFRFNHEH